MCVCVCVCVCVCIYIYLHIYVCIYLSIYVHCTYAPMCNIGMHTCVHTHFYMYSICMCIYV